MKRSDSILQQYYMGGKLPKYQQRPGTVRERAMTADERLALLKRLSDLAAKTPRTAPQAGRMTPELQARIAQRAIEQQGAPLTQASPVDLFYQNQLQKYGNTPADIERIRKEAEIPFLIGTGALTAGLAAPFIPGIGSAIGAGMTYAPIASLPGATAGNLLTSAGVASAITSLPETGRSIGQAFTSGDSGDIGTAVANVGFTGLNLLPVYGPASRQISQTAANVAQHPLVATLPYVISRGAGKEYLGAAMIAGVDKLSPILSSNPLTRGLYKKAAERVASASLGQSRSLNQIMSALFTNKPRTYKGMTGAFVPERNLIRNYIYGDTRGFEPSDLPITGLDKYVARYGPLSRYKLNTNIINDQPYPAENLISDLLDPNLSAYANKLTSLGSYDDKVRALKKILRRKGTISFGSENSGIGGDDIAGHMKFLSYDPASRTYNVKTQDIWKFTPEDYNPKWGINLATRDYFKSSNNEHIKNYLESYMKTKQASLMDKAGKPFVLLDQRPISISKPAPKELYSLNTSTTDYTPGELEEMGLTSSEIADVLAKKSATSIMGVQKNIDDFDFNSIINKPLQFKPESRFKKQGGPIVNQRGFMDGVPPQGSNWRIMGDGQGTAITMDLPNMPDEILVVPDGDFDQAKVMKRGEEDYFMGADFVDEYLLKDGGLTPNKAREILHDKEVHGKSLTEKQRRYFGAMSKGHTKKYMSGGGYGAFGYVPKMQLGETVEDKRALAKRVVEIAKRRAKNKEWVPVPESIKAAAENLGEGAANCIGGVCTVLKEANVIPNVIWTNTEFARQAPKLGFNKANRGWGLKGIENLEPADVVQWMYTGSKNPNKAVPEHAQIYLGVAPDGELLFFDNFNEEIRSYPKDKIENLLSWNRKPNEDQMQIYKVNPYTPPPASSRNPEAQKALEERQRNVDFQTDLGNNRLVNYVYELRPDSPYYGSEDAPEGMKRFFGVANDPEWISDVVQKVDKAGYPKRANREEIQDSLLNVFGILGVENKWDNPYLGGSYGVESLIERTTSPSNLSIGPGQIKYSQLSRGLRKAFNINRPQDLQDFNKVLPLMVGIDIANKQWMENQGERFSERIIGQPGLSSQQMIWDEGRMSPYFYRGLGDRNVRKRLEREYGDKWYDFLLPDQMIQSRKEGEDPAAREEFVRKNIRGRQKVFDPGSYGRRVFENIDRNLLRKIVYDNYFDTEPSAENAIDLPEVTITGKRRPNMQRGGIFSTLPSNAGLRFLPAISEFFTGSSKKASAPAVSEESILDKFPAFINVNDPRRVRMTTGQRINPNVDLVSGEYRTDLLTPALIEARKQGLSKEDIWDMATIAFQESGWGKTDENIGHVSGVLAKGPSEDPFVNAYLSKMKEADRLGMSDPIMRLQVYNGLGMIKPDTERDYHGYRMKKIYGVPVPEEGISMRRNPLYGKQIIDLRDNVLKKNPAVVQYIDSIYQGNYQLGGNIAGMLRDYGAGISVPPRFQDGGRKVKQSDEAVARNLMWMNDWINSPMATRMLYNSLKNSGELSMSPLADVEGLKKLRSNFAKNTNFEEYPSVAVLTNEERKSNNVVPAGFGIRGTASYKSNVGPYVVPETGYIKFVKQEDPYKESQLLTHEISHRADASGKLIPSSDIALMDKYAKYPRLKISPFTEEEKFQSYLAIPSETRARLNEIRRTAGSFRFYDPFTQKAPSDILKLFEIGLNPELSKPINELRTIYTDDQIIDMLNKISMRRNQGLPFAKSGGQHGGLDRWFAEKWVDIKTGKPCGRQEGESRAYPACRPSRRVSSKTPKTSSELSSAEREKFKRSKTSSERISYSHKRRK